MRFLRAKLPRLAFLILASVSFTQNLNAADTMESLIANQALTQETAEVLAGIVSARLNVLISAGARDSRSSKRHLTNATA